ncbi:MAG: 50S ribosomal protein L18e [Candidatus Aenigmatarchaeota archaeon]
MPKPTGPTNPILKQAITELKSGGHKYKMPFAVAIAEKMGKPTRRKTEVDVSAIERFANRGETVMVPGKVLGSGRITKPVTIAAAAFSASAAGKIEKAGGKIITITELIEKNPKGTGVRILC